MQVIIAPRDYFVKNTFKNLLFLFAVICVTASCSSSKKNAKYSFPERAYQDVTARFNGYYHAKLKVNETLKSNRRSPKDNFQEILTIEPNAGGAGPGEAKTVMDEAIKKASIALQLHPKSKWVDDCYLIIGRAHVLSGNQEEAQKTFQYIISRYKKTYPEEAFSKSQKKKRQKKLDDGKKGLSIFDHSLARSEAFIYLLESYTLAGMTDEANQLIKVLSSNENLMEDESFTRSLAKNVAQLKISSGDYEGAIESLTTVAETKLKKKDARRINFILAQLNQKVGNNAEAIQHYDLVLNANPDYEMGFYSTLFKTQVAQETGKLDDAQVALILEKLLKDEKNEEFKGDIFYTLGLISLNEGDEKEAIFQFRESIKNAGKPQQKAGAYLMLGDIFWNKESYLPSYSYYDSTMGTLPNNHSRFEEIGTRRDKLKVLAEHLRFIQEQDSIERWNKLSPEERLEILKKNQLAGDKEKTEIQMEKFKNNPKRNFELYNPVLRAKGFADFKSRWGSRRLDDNWRRSDKSEDQSREDEPLQDRPPVLSAIDKDKKDKKEKKGKSSNSDEKWADALFQSGVIFMDELENIPKAIGSFTDLNQRFPDNKFQLESHYRLYQLYKGQRKTDLSNGQKALILVKFPNSRIAQILDNPNFLAEQKALSSQLETAYANSLKAYQDGDYASAESGIKEFSPKAKGTDHAPRFMLLNALVIGNTESKENFIAALNPVVKEFPEHECGIKALEILERIGKKGGTKPKNDKKKANFKLRKNEIHYFAIFVNESGTKVNNLKTAVSDYNKKYFSLDKLKVQSSLYNLDKSIVLVKHFIGMDKASNFSKSWNKLGQELLKDFKAEDYDVFIISKSNFAELMKSKDIFGYLKFFKDNYP